MAHLMEVARQASCGRQRKAGLTLFAISELASAAIVLFFRSVFSV